MVGSIIQWLRTSTAGLVALAIAIGAFVWGWNKIDAQEQTILELQRAVAQNERVIEGYKQDMLLHKRMILELEQEKKIIESTVNTQKETIDKIIEDGSKDEAGNQEGAEVLRMRLPNDVIGILRTDPSAVP